VRHYFSENRVNLASDVLLDYYTMKDSIRFSLLSALLMGFSLTTFSQYEKQNIKISPLSLVDDVSFPAIQAGYEKSLSERFSIYNEAGIRYRRSFLENADTSFINGFGFRVKSEVRYYMPKSFGYEGIKTVLNGLYMAANVFYKRDSHNSSISYHPGEDSLLVTNDDFAVRKNVIGVNLLIGLQKKLVNHFCFDIYFGLGYRIRFINDSHLEFDPKIDRLIKPEGYDIKAMMNNVDVKNGTSYSPSITMGLRLGYRF
jgi:hypothetical protein